MGAASVSWAVRMPGKGKLSDVVGVTSVLLVSEDPYSGDAQDKEGLGRVWARSFLGSSSSRGSGTSQSGVKVLGVDVGESSNNDGRNSEHECRLAEWSAGMETVVNRYKAWNISNIIEVLDHYSDLICQLRIVDADDIETMFSMAVRRESFIEEKKTIVETGTAAMEERNA